MQALEAYREALLAQYDAVPHFDPLDGGADAPVLILMETPGPGATPLRFVSRDNPTGTARNLRRFLAEAGIARADTVLWNVVPWVVHPPGARNRPLRRGEIAAGLGTLPSLLAALPRLRIAILAGRPAAGAAPIIARERPNIAVLVMPHPSPTYVCTSPAVPQRIAAVLAEARALLG